jgi:hypothetical protein
MICCRIPSTSQAHDWFCMASGSTGGWRSEPHEMLVTLLHPARLHGISQPREAVSNSVEATLLLHSLATQLLGWLLLLRLLPAEAGSL